MTLTIILGRAECQVSEAARYVKDTTQQVIPVTAEVPDAADSLNIEFERREADTRSRNRSR